MLRIGDARHARGWGGVTTLLAAMKIDEEIPLLPPAQRGHANVSSCQDHQTVSGLQEVWIGSNDGVDSTCMKLTSSQNRGTILTYAHEDIFLGLSRGVHHA